MGQKFSQNSIRLKTTGEFYSEVAEPKLGRKLKSPKAGYNLLIFQNEQTRPGTGNAFPGRPTAVSGWAGGDERSGLRKDRENRKGRRVDSRE